VIVAKISVKAGVVVYAAIFAHLDVALRALLVALNVCVFGFVSLSATA